MAELDACRENMKNCGRRINRNERAEKDKEGLEDKDTHARKIV